MWSKALYKWGNETGKITCECNHTTSFSILMSHRFSIDHMALAYITYIGVAISMASLIICLIIETIVWKSVRRNDTSYIRHVSIVTLPCPCWSQTSVLSLELQSQKVSSQPQWVAAVQWFSSCTFFIWLFFFWMLIVSTVALLPYSHGLFSNVKG